WPVRTTWIGASGRAEIVSASAWASARTEPSSATVVEPAVGTRTTSTGRRRASVSSRFRTVPSPAALRLPELTFAHSTARATMAGPRAATWCSTVWSGGRIRMRADPSGADAKGEGEATSSRSGSRLGCGTNRGRHSMTDWAKAMNPTSPLTTEDEALGAARASAIAIFLGVIWGIVGVLYLMSGAGQEAMAAALAQSGGSPEAANMTGMMSQVALWMSVFFVVLQLILGFVQWTKPNKVIPILFIILVVYGLGSTALGQVMAGELPEAAQS